MNWVFRASESTFYVATKQHKVQTYQLLEALLPGVWVFVLLGADLVEPAWLRVHHGTCVLKHLHV